jgi:citrate lyase beta subunit
MATFIYKLTSADLDLEGAVHAADRDQAWDQVEQIRQSRWNDFTAMRVLTQEEAAKLDD